MNLAPLALFVYNRLEHTQRTLEALRANELAADSELFIFSDGARTAAGQPLVEELRTHLRTVSGFGKVEIIERSSNLGLAGSIISGVGELCERFGRVIVLEDDLVTSPWFLTYMNQALELYRDDPQVASIHGYCYPAPAGTLPETFFLRGADCWGWATWNRAWQLFERDGTRLLHELQRRGLCRQFDLDGAYPYTAMLRNQIAGRVDSWAIRWHAACFLAGCLTLYPGRSLVRNIGLDGSGTHCEASAQYGADIASRPIELERIALEPSALAGEMIREFLRDTTRVGWLDTVGMGGLRDVLHRVRDRIRRAEP
jgi:hypothetical protein